MIHHRTILFTATLLIASLPAVVAPGCVAAPESKTGDAPIGRAGEQQTDTCVTIQRATGGVVADADVEAVAPNTNFGSAPQAIVGWPTPSGSQKLLLSFDVGFILPGTVITSATATLTPTGGAPTSGTVTVRRVTAPWQEQTVTWASSFFTLDTTILASFFDGGGLSTPISFDLTALTQSWVSGALPNDGIVLVQEPPNATQFWTSEGAAEVQPALTVCYAPPPIASCPGSTFPSEGLAALWAFDDGAPTATDSSGNGNTGTFVGDVSYDDANLPPIPGDVASLDIRNGGYVSVPTSPSLVIPGSLSVAAWVRIESPVGEHNVISKDNPGMAFSNYNLNIEGNYAYFSLAFDTGSAAGGFEVASPISGTNGTAGCDEGGCYIQSATPFIDAAHLAGTWRLLTGVYDNAAKTLSVYIDCGDVAVGTFATTGVPYTGIDTVQIGLRKYSPLSVWTGGVDNVAIWSLALSPAEVTGTP
jgi:Concanavalin A-like lectin/glucanases superfamily